MSRVKQIGMAAATFGVALGVGFVMQNGDALAGRFGADGEPAGATVTPVVAAAAVSPATEVEQVLAEAPTPDPSPIAEPEDATSSQTDLATAEPVARPTADVEPVVALAEPESVAPEMASPNTDLESASMIAIPEVLRSPEPVTEPSVLANAEIETSPSVVTDATPQAVPEIAEACLIGMQSTVTPGALVEVSVEAPCHANSPFTVHHQGMMFTAQTDADGAAMVVVPALAEVAVVIAAFPDGEGNVTTSSVPDLTNYDRAVLQWTGEADVMLSAYEFGAAYGDPGHISRANLQDRARLEAGEGGFLLSLGADATEDALFAEVYTFPSGMIRGGGDVRIVAEAEITENNCGQELSAQSLQVDPSGVTNALDLYMVMPECDAVGDFLILQNMFEDLTLASR